MRIFSVASSTAPGFRTGAPLEYFWNSFGPVSRSVMHLGWIFAGICVSVCLIITLLLLIAIWRRRSHTGDSPVKPDDERSGLRWMLIGTLISAAVLLCMTIYMLVVLDHISKPPQTPDLTITVTAHNWWWEVEYSADDPSRRFVTANEIHVPVGVPMLFKLKSADVIHAFWVPHLAGKTQTIPGIINRQWFQADEPGRYLGTCAQFCGLQHAHMRFEVVAQQQEEFNTWLENQRKSAVIPVAAALGHSIFMKRCAGCHTIRGTDAAGRFGPDLTHLQTRNLIAAGMLENTPENLGRWISDTQEIKPGVNMPATDLGKDELAALVGYLEGLQ